MKKTRLLILCLLAAELTSAVSCGESAAASEIQNNDSAAPVVTEPAETEENILRADLPDTDWGGREFRVLGREDLTHSQFSNFEIYSEKEDGEIVNDAIFRRNSAIQEKYNVKITQSLFSLPNEELIKNSMAGDDLFDLAFIDLETIGTCAQQGCFYDLNRIEFIDFSQPWWNPEVNDTVSIGGRVFYTSSDFSLRDKSRAYILTYNPQIVSDYDMPDLLGLVRDGTWTIERMTECVRMVSGDIDGDGKMTEKDAYGLPMDSYNAFAAFIYGCDNHILVHDADGMLAIDMNSEHMVNSVDKVITLTCDTNYAFFCNDFDGKVSGDIWRVSGDAFEGGRGLFNTAFPHSLKDFAGKCDFEYTVIPFPKYDESQEKYTTMADVYCMLFGIPSSSAAPEFSGFMLEALSAASTDTTLKAYYDISCQTKYAANPASAEMLDLIFDGICFDNGVIFRYTLGLYGILSDSLPKVKKNNFSSLYARIERSSLKTIDKLNQTMLELD